jgi:hypothetical protein
MPVSMRRNGRWSGARFDRRVERLAGFAVDRALVAVGVGQPLFERLDLVGAHLRGIEARRAGGREDSEGEQNNPGKRREPMPRKQLSSNHGVPAPRG